MRGGSIVTVNDAMPNADAVAIKDGKILVVGSNDEILKYQGAQTEIVDWLGVRCFLDSSMVMVIALQLYSGCIGKLARPPDYKVTDIPGILAELKTFAKSDNAKKYGIILGFGYDDAQLKEQRHPTRHDLDEVSKDVPYT